MLTRLAVFNLKINKWYITCLDPPMIIEWNTGLIYTK
jgi:hypothetical protein